MMDGESYNCRACGGNHAVGFCKAMGEKIPLKQEVQMAVESLQSFFQEITMPPKTRKILGGYLEQMRERLGLPKEKIYFGSESTDDYTIPTMQKLWLHELITGELQTVFSEQVSVAAYQETFYDRLIEQLKEAIVM